MGAGGHGDVLLGDVDADAQTLGIDVGEVASGLFCILVRNVQAHVVDAVNFHLLVDGACHNVARCERQAFVVFLHEFGSVRQAQNAAVAAHGFGDEKGGVGFAGVIERGGVELHKLHVFHRGFGAIGHGNAVAGGYVGVGGGGVNGSAASGGHHRDARQEGVNLAGVGVEDVGAIAFDVGRAARNLDAQVVLGDDFNGKVVLEDGDGGVGKHGFDEAALDFEAGVISMVQNAKLAVAALAMEVEGAVSLLVEIHAPFHQAADGGGTAFHHLLNGTRVADVVAGHKGVLDVLAVVVFLHVRNAGNASLRFGCVALFDGGFAHKGHFPLARFGHLKGVAHAGHS